MKKYEIYSGLRKYQILSVSSLGDKGEELSLQKKKSFLRSQKKHFLLNFVRKLHFEVSKAVLKNL